MFVTFEGIEGSGKSSLIAALAEELRDTHPRLLVTREPGGTTLGDAVRHIFLGKTAQIGPLAEVFLLNASRAQLVDEVIAPALKDERLVLCDRFFDATIAYQGFGRGLDVETVFEVSLVASERIAPDLTFLLDVPVAVSRERVAARARAAGEVPDRMEQEDDGFHERVRDGYRKLAKRFTRYVVLDGTQSIPTLVTAARQAIDARRATH